MNAQDLKSSILQRAIEGKLVPQRKEEGTAKELLAEIRAEKARLVKEKKIKKSKPLPEITDAEKPFDIPDSWEWVRFEDVFEIARGGSPRPIKQFLTESDDGINWIKIGDTDIGGKYILCSKEKIIPEGLSKTRLVESGDLLLTNSMSYGRPYILKTSGAIHDGWLVLSPYLKQTDKEFFYYVISSAYVHNEFARTVSGGVVKNLNKDKVKKIIIPLPPLAEQHRIVAKIEELQPDIDAYDKAQTEIRTIEQRFPEAMKKSLLQYAIEGKLVPQRKEEGTAKELLAEIRAEKARLVKEKKIKKSKPLPEITDAEKPFDIPDSWEWVRFEDVFEIARGGSPRPIKQFLTESDDGINWIKIGDTDIGGKYILCSKEKIIPEGLSKTRLVESGDLLLTNSMSYGRPYILKTSGAIHDGWLVLSPYLKQTDKEFFYYVISSAYVHNEFARTVSGGVVKNLNKDKVKKIIIPLPPLAEQHRIVAKLEELLPLCQHLTANP